ncbi:S41 family peptidase [Bradyrhizobium sp. USDA 10063]
MTELLHNQRSLLIFMALCAFFLGSRAVLAQITIPDTPAGRTLNAFLEAFNSGDRTKVQDYQQKFGAKIDVDGLMAFRRQTGGFDLLSIDASEPLWIKFRVKEKASPTVAVGRLRLKSGAPEMVDTQILRAMPPGAVFEDLALDAQSRERVIDGAIANLKELYVFPDLAQKMADALKSHLKSGDYDGTTDGVDFASLLTQHLQAVNQDRHLYVIYNPFTQPAGRSEPGAADQKAQMAKQMQRINCGFEKIEILPGNIGYLKFNMFADPAICGSTATAAMNFLAHVDAVIFDLRNNGGGDPKMIALISSYLFDQPTHLNDIFNRKEDSTTQFWTLPFVPGVRLTGKPAFVLTSKTTFSGAEEFCYNLKNLKRATIVGETTGGGAHPVMSRPIDDHFVIGVPFARAINPISKTNWEGTGVEPDVSVKASDALDVAIELATRKIQAN